MSCQKGNASRSRSQKYQNHTTFKNNLHDNSKKIKFINSIEVINVCERCKKIIEWKIKYKKYKVLKAPMKCTKCEQKTVKHSYHNICLPCAKQNEICPKCGNKKENKEINPNKEELNKLDEEFQTILKTISERKQRMFLDYMNQHLAKNKQHMSPLDTDTNDDDGKNKHEDKIDPKEREDLLTKLKSLAITEEEDNNFDDSDSNTDIENR